jgi:hypothetical protein
MTFFLTVRFGRAFPTSTLAGLALSLFWLVQPSQPSLAAPMTANPCRHSIKVNRLETIGSQVDGSLLTLCMTKTQTQVRPIPMPGSTNSQSQPKAGATSAPHPNKPAPVATPLKPNPGVRFKVSRRTGIGTFKPQVAPQVAQPTTGKVGQLFTISTNQLVRRGWGYLLGQRVQVRFAPVVLRWSILDGYEQAFDSARQSISHAFTSEGTYSVVLHVTFTVQYRPWGSSRWILEPAKLTLPANVLSLQVGKSVKKGRHIVLLNPKT